MASVRKSFFNDGDRRSSGRLSRIAKENPITNSS